MAVNLKNFVNVNLDYFVTTTASGTRDTAVLLEVNDVPASGQEPHLSKADHVYTSLEEFAADLTVSSGPKEAYELYKYVRCFFANNGKKLHIIRMPELPSGETTDSWIKKQLKGIPKEEIVVASTANESVMRSIAASILEDAEFSGISEKILVSHIDQLQWEETIEVPNESDPTADPTTQTITVDFEFPHLDNYILKFNNNNGLGATPSLGSEMSILAFLTKVNVQGNKPISDYCYTKEVAEFSYVNNDAVVKYSYLDEDNDDVVKIMDNNANVDTILVNQSLVVGGNTTGGKDLVNHFVKIVLTQTMTDRLVKLLATKIRYNQTGINLISNTIVSELNKYKNFGYLTTSKIWEEDDLYVEVNGQEYLLISNQEPLITGYKFIILPLTSLSEEDKQKHLLPKIFLLVADSYAIRTIQISGWVY